MPPLLEKERARIAGAAGEAWVFGLVQIDAWDCKKHAPSQQKRAKVRKEKVNICVLLSEFGAFLKACAT